MGLYNTRAWKDLRARQLALEPLCRYCLEQGIRTPATVADHRTPHRGNRALFFDAGNLQSLCKTCHDATKQAFEKSGRLRGSNLEGLPLDPRHHWYKGIDE